MASGGVTFSGFNNVDFNLILNSMMTQASQPLTALQTRQTSLQSQIRTYGTLGTKITALQSAAKDLSDPDGLNSFSAQSSNTASLGASAGVGSAAGQYEVIVNELARAQVTASTSSAPDASTTVVATGGSITIGGKTVTLSGDTTLQQLADKINATTDIPVQAAVVRASAGNYKLTLTGSLSGAANAFTITNQLTGGSGLAFADGDNDGTSGDSPADNAMNATDAALLVNNVAVTGSSNTFEDVIPGVTLTAYVKDPNTTVRVDVTSDTSGITTKLQKFVTAYNDIAKFMGDQRTSSIAGDGASIGRDPLLRQLSGSLRTMLLGAHGSDVMTRLSEMGVEFTSTGTMQLNQKRLDNALATNSAAVRNLLGGTDGAFTDVTELLKNYSQTSGLISTVKDRLTAQIKTMDSQIDAMQARLAQQRETLQRQFTDADMTLSRLKSQQSSLSSFGSGLSSL